jgi:hypothetical protein
VELSGVPPVVRDEAAQAPVGFAHVEPGVMDTADFGDGRHRPVEQEWARGRALPPSKGLFPRIEL